MSYRPSLWPKVVALLLLPFLMLITLLLAVFALFGLPAL